jgi:hypothetical protein
MGSANFVFCFAGLVTTLFCVPSSPALELVPQVKDRPAGDGGIILKEWVFPDENGEEVAYDPPPGWKYRPGPQELLFTPGPPQATVQIQATMLDAPLPFDLAGIESLKEQSLRAVPPGAEEVEIVSDDAHFVAPSDEYQDHEVVVKYILQGVKFKRSIAYMQRGNLLLRFVTTAREEDFEAIRETLRASLFSWRWRPEGSDV